MKRPLFNLLMLGFTLWMLTACGSSTPDGSLPVNEPAGTPTLHPNLPLDPAQLPPTLTPTLYADPAAQLTIAQLDALLNPFNPAGCSLPCYNSLIPGVSDLQDVVLFYNRLGVGVGDLTPGEFDAVLDGSGDLGAALAKTTDIAAQVSGGYEPPRLEVQVSDFLVRYFYVGWAVLPPYLSPTSVLSEIGPPDDLQIGLVLDREIPTFLVTLIYETEAGSYGFAYYGETGGDATARTICIGEKETLIVLMGSFASDVEPLGIISEREYLLPVRDALGLQPVNVMETLSSGCLILTPEQLATWGSPGN